MQPKKINMNEMDYGRWNEWDGLWTEGNENETWSVKCGLKETYGRKWDETWAVTCGLKDMRWNVNNEGDNVIFPSWSLTTLQVGQK